MSKRAQQFLYWSPRVLTILFAVLVSIFALDVFDESYTFTETVVALFMHLIPTLIIVAVLALAWRHEWVGGILFTVLGLVVLIPLLRGRGYLTDLILAGPPLMAGVLFLLNWRFRDALNDVAQG